MSGKGELNDAKGVNGSGDLNLGEELMNTLILKIITLAAVVAGLTGLAIIGIGCIGGLGGGSRAFAKGPGLKVIDFDDEVVEGLGQRPLDSVTEIRESARNHPRAHLYHKRVGFRTETAQTLHDLRYN